MKSLPPFYIGQRVVCLIDLMNHTSRGSESLYAKKGTEFTVLNTSYCCTHLIDIGSRADNSLICCYHCGRISPGNIVWADANVFAPVEEKFQAITLSKVEEKELVQQ